MRYTEEGFFYNMLNKTLRENNMINIFQIRYAIKEINKALAKIQSTMPKYPKVLFRGTFIHSTELDFMKTMIDKPFLLRGFISTSADEKEAKEFLKFGKKRDQMKKMMLILENSNNLEYGFDISKHSLFPNESEYLLKTNTFVMIKNFVEEPMNDYFELKCEFISFDKIKDYFDPMALQYKNDFDKEMKENVFFNDKLYLAHLFN